VSSIVRVLAAALALLAGAAHAEQPISKAYSACMEKSGGVTANMQDCIGAEFEAQDRRLNAAYKALNAAGNDKRKTAIRDAQRKWIAFRDANCALYGDGGSAGRIAANECLLHHTARRAEELENLKQD
jgi:uncharacterized protein YecT (DUF1311 family)